VNESFTVYIEELDKVVKFVDRVRELHQLDEIVSRGTAFPVAIYGPEGCGKTALLKYVARSLAKRSDTIVIYIDALEQFELEKALLSSHREVLEVVRDVSSVPIGSALARLCMSLVTRLASRISLKGKNVVLLIDDVYRAIGLENVDRYTKSLYEWIGYLHEKFEVSNVAIILTTSEGVSKRELSKHTYVDLRMLWNLSREGFEELVQQLDQLRNVDVEELWILTGGNPRALIDIARRGWNVERWMEYLYEGKIRRAMHLVGREKLRSLAEDPDSDWVAAERLEEMGLMIELRRASAVGTVPDPCTELGVGRDWAWQLPAYRYVVLRRIGE